MHQPRLPFALAAGLAAALAVAVPAGASEGQPGPPPPAWGNMTPPAITPPAGGVLPSTTKSRPAIRSAKIKPRRIKRGKRAVLHLTLSSPGKVTLTISRRSKPKRGRVAVKRVQATGTTVAIRLPRRAHGKKLAAGRYRVAIVTTDALGTRSKTVHRSFVVR